MVEEETRQGTEGGENTHAVRPGTPAKSIRKARGRQGQPEKHPWCQAQKQRACTCVHVQARVCLVLAGKKKTTLEYREQNLLLLLDSGRARRSQPLQTASVNQQDCLQEIPDCHRFPPSTDDPKYWLIALVERRKHSGRGQQLCISWNRADEKKIYIFIYFKDPGKEPKRKVLSQGLAVFRRCRARLFFLPHAPAEACQEKPSRSWEKLPPERVGICSAMASRSRAPPRLSLSGEAEELQLEAAEASTAREGKEKKAKEMKKR